MSKVTDPEDVDPLDNEITNFEGAVRGKYAARMEQECNVVVIDDDLAKIFPNRRAVNDALRFLVQSGNYPRPNLPRTVD